MIQQMLDAWKWDCKSGEIPLLGHWTISRLDKWLPEALRLGDLDSIQRVREYLGAGE